MFDRVTTAGIAPHKVGVAGMPALTLFQTVGPAYHEAPGQEAAESAAPVEEGSPHLWLAALLVLVAALWIVNQHVQFGPLNLAFLVIVVMAVSVVLKTIFGRFHVPGLSQVVLAA